MEAKLSCVSRYCKFTTKILRNAPENYILKRLLSVTDIPSDWYPMGEESWIKAELDSDCPDYVKVWKLFKASQPKFKRIEKVGVQKSLKLCKQKNGN